MRLVAAQLKRDPRLRLTFMTDLAAAEPELAYTQEFAAREAWRQGDVELARKFAVRAISLDPDSLAPLRILAEASASCHDNHQTYQYAKRLLQATRIDKQAEPWICITIAPFRLFPKYRVRVRDFLENYVPKNDEWVVWAREYVNWYEAGNGTSRANP